MYGEGGELAIPEEELKTYYTDNYYSYEFFYAPLSKSNEDGTSTDLSDDEKAELKKHLREIRRTSQQRQDYRQQRPLTTMRKNL